MEGEAADDQHHGVDRGEKQLKFVGAALLQGIHGPEGEVGREEARESHAIGHQEGGQAKQAKISMPFGVLLGGRASVAGIRTEVGAAGALEWCGAGHACTSRPRSWCWP